MKPDSSEQLEMALEQCARRMELGESIEDILAAYPEDTRQGLRDLLPVAARVRTLASDPDAAFRANLRASLVSQTREAKARSRSSRWPGLTRALSLSPAWRIAVVLFVLAALVFGGGAGVVQVSASSLPGDPLYQVKEAREWVELNLARDDSGQVAVYVKHITERQRELEWAVRTRQPLRVIEGLAIRYGNAIETMVQRALAAKAKGIKQPSVVAAALLERLQSDLEAASQRGEPGARPIVRRLLSTLEVQQRHLVGGS